MRARPLAILAALALTLSLLAGPGGVASAKAKAKKKPPLTFSLVTVQRGGGEPSILASKDGYVYYSSPDGGPAFYFSRNRGRTWTKGGDAAGGSGDSTVNVDESGAVYQGNLESGDDGPFQGQIYKSFDHGRTWPQHGTTPTDQNSATGNPFQVDRQWTDAYIPPGMTTDQARVYFSYHDFGPSMVWANTSKDGGKTFGLPIPVITDPVALQASFCNTIPGGTSVVRSGPHAGRVYVAWLAADGPTNLATGCNYTELDTFHTVWIAWSDDEGTTWTDHLVYDAGPTHDAAAIFADLTVDRAGNPYVSFPENLSFTEDLKGQWSVYVEASFDGGTTWNGSATGAGAPIRVDKDTGTHIFPAIAAGAPGKVIVAYLATPSVIPALPYGKPSPGGDANAKWYLWVGETMNLRATTPKWTVKKLTVNPLHTGDVCTYGIFCIPTVSNRALLDFIDVTLDTAGYAYVAYTDTELNAGRVARQTAGPRLA